MKSKSTYSLILNSATEEKGRSLFEISVYVLVLLCMAVSGWHFASTSVTLPRKSPKQNAAPSMLAETETPVVQSPVIASRG